MSSTKVWIGIDGGGTKTKAYLIDGSKMLLCTLWHGEENRLEELNQCCCFLTRLLPSKSCFSS